MSLLHSNVEDGIQIRVYKFFKESATHFSPFQEKLREF